MSDLKEGFGKAAKAVVKGSGAVIKSASLNIKLSGAESDLKGIYTDIGRAVHEIYKHGGSLGSLFDEKYEKILETEAKIAELKVKLEIAKGTVTCGRCAATSKRGSAFCPKCGEGLDGGEPAPPPRDSETSVGIVGQTHSDDVAIPNTPPPAPVGRVCNVCGTNNDVGDRFCLSCGRIM